MVWTIVLILIVLWFVGFITSYTFGGLIHILLVIAVKADGLHFLILSSCWGCYSYRCGVLGLMDSKSFVLE